MSDDKNEIAYNYTVANFPTGPNRVLENFETISFTVNAWLLIPIMMTFVIMTQVFMAEKEKDLRKGLMLFGVNSFTYWMSWILTCFMISLAYGLMIWFGGWATGVTFFRRSPFFILYMIFVVTSFVYHIIAMVVAASVGTSEAA